MATKQGYLKEKGSQDKLAPKTLDSLVKDSARNRALSASLQELAERQCLGYPPFATTQNYAVGDKVFHDRKLWKFTSSHTAGAWNASHVTAWSVEDEVSELKLAVTELDERKANIDGFYEGMGVGVAKRLEGNTDVAGSFLERPTGGDAELANGLAQLNEVQGGSVKFNQLAKLPSSGSSFATNANTTVTFSNGVSSITVGSSSAAGTANMLRAQIGQNFNSFISGHKYLFSAIMKASQGASVKIKRTVAEDIELSVSTSFQVVRCICTASFASDGYPCVGGNTNDVIQIKDESFMWIDLTAIFGAGNEPSTVAEFEAWLAENVGLKDYYDYTEGEVVNNNMTGIESTGFNLFNPTTGKARIIGAYSEVYGNYYGITGTHGTLTFEDDLGNVSTITPDSDGKFELDVSGYLSVADAGNDVAVFLWWDGKKTEYEDYDVEIAHLDVRHIYGKKNGTGELVQVWPTGMPRINDIVDKLCIENGAVVAKRFVQEVDLGTLSYGKISTSEKTTRFSVGRSLLPDMKYVSVHTDVPNLLCPKYNTICYNSLTLNDKVITGTTFANEAVTIKDTTYSGGTQDAFKTAMSGVMLYYELATPETYTDLVYMGSEYFADGTPVALPVNYKVDNWGVESILPKNTSTINTAKPTIKVRYAIDAVEQLNTHSDEIESLHDDIDELDAAKANTVGVYDDLVVGAAKAIAGNHRLDKVFTSMVVEGADGVAKINEVRGKSLVWNQLINGDNSCTATGDTTKTQNSDGTITVAPIQDTLYGVSFSKTKLVKYPSHIYYMSVIIKSSEASGTVLVGMYAYTGVGLGNAHQQQALSTSFARCSFITSNAISSSYALGIYCEANNAPVDFTFKNFMVIDLTQMFGAGNEPATVEEFEKLFPDAYYEYNAGEIINNATEELDVTGFNQWDEEWEKGSIDNNTGEKIAANIIRSKNYIDVFGNTIYNAYSSTYNMVVFFYDSQKRYITRASTMPSSTTFRTHPDARYMLFRLQDSYGVTYNHDICINISDPSRNGTYEPYKHGVVPLNLSTITGKQVGVENAESVVIFPDGMRQAGSVADTLLVDDDGYARRAVVKIGSVDLGTLTWSKSEIGASSGFYRFNSSGLASYLSSSYNNIVYNCVCEKYLSVSANDTYIKKDGIGVDSTKNLCLYDSANQALAADAFKAAMDGVELIYELAEYKEYILDEPILMTFKAYHGGTIVQSQQAPDSAPMSMNVTFALDAIGTLNNLPKNYISADSMDAFLAQLGTAMNGTWTKSWDAANNRYGFTFTPNA